MTFNLKGLRDILSLLVLVVMLVVPYFRGLFFEPETYRFELIILLLLIAALWMAEKERLQQSMAARRWTILLLPLVYSLSPLQAASHEMAYQGVYRIWTFAAIYVLGVALLATPLRRLTANVVLIISALWIALFGWLNFFGWVGFKDAVLGNRLASVFQYPNTLAAFLSAFFITGLILASERKWLYTLIGSFLAFVAGVSILLTYSRGGWLVWAGAYLVVMFFLPVRHQLRYFICSIPVFAAMLAALPQMVAAQGSKSIGVLILMLVIGAVAALVSLALAWSTERIGRKRSNNSAAWWRRLILPVALILLAVILAVLVLNSPALVDKLPDSVAKRIGDIKVETNSVLQRGIFTQDALKIFADHPVIGAGGGAWKALFQKYQDYPYWSTTTHNYWVQILTETGALGFAAWALFLVVLAIGLLRQYYRRDEAGQVRLTYYAAAIVILLGHSFIDFNMSFAYYAGLVYLLYALLVVEMDDAGQPMVSKQEAQEKKAKPDDSYNWLPNLMRWGGTVIAVLLIIGVSRYIMAEGKYKEGLELIKDQNSEGVQYVKQAVSLNRSSAEYQRVYADLLYQIGSSSGNQGFVQESVARMQKAIALEPNNPVLLTQAAQFYARMGDGLKTLEMSKRAVESAPWNEAIQYNYMNVLYQVGMAYLKENKSIEEAKSSFDTLLTQYEEVGKGVAHIQSLPPALEKGRPFRQTEGMKLLVGKTYYEQQQWQQLREMLLPLTKSKDANTQLEAAAYLVAGSQKERDLLTQQQLDEIQGLVKDQAQLQKQINDIQALPVISG